MDAVGTAGAERVTLLECTPLADLAKLLDVLDDDVGRLDKLIAQSGVAQIRRRHAKVHPAAGLGLALGNVLIDILAHIGKEGDDIMVGYRLDGVDLLLVEGRMLTNPRSLFFGDADLSQLGLCLAGKHLDLLPDSVLVLQREDVTHLGTGIAINHVLSLHRRPYRRLTAAKRNNGTSYCMAPPTATPTAGL